jgi:hypothetical protein
MVPYNPYAIEWRWKMPNKAQPFTHYHLVKAFKAASAAGVPDPVVRVSLANGTTIAISGKPGEAAAVIPKPDKPAAMLPKRGKPLPTSPRAPVGGHK